MRLQRIATTMRRSAAERLAALDGWDSYCENPAVFLCRARISRLSGKSAVCRDGGRENNNKAILRLQDLSAGSVAGFEREFAPTES